MRINLAGVEGNLEVWGRGEEPAELWEPPLGWAAWRRATARGRGAGVGLPPGLGWGRTSEAAGLKLGRGASGGGSHFWCRQGERLVWAGIRQRLDMPVTGLSVGKFCETGSL